MSLALEVRPPPGSKLESWLESCEGRELTKEGNVFRSEGRDDDIGEGKDLTKSEICEGMDSSCLVTVDGTSSSLSIKSPTVLRASDTTSALRTDDRDPTSLIDESTNLSRLV
jgi:hypothetical protein